GAGTHEGVLVEVAEGHAGDQEGRAPRDELDALDHAIGLGVLPAPQVEVLGPAERVLAEPRPRVAPAPLEARQVAVEVVGHGHEGKATPWSRERLDLEALADLHADDLAAGEVEEVVGDGEPRAVPGRCAGFEQPVRDDDPARRATDLDAHRYL